jgi:predicted amidohydrolase
MNISLLQYNIVHDNPTRNLDTIEMLVKSPCRHGTDLAVLPETCTTGFGGIMKNAEPDDGETITLLRTLSQETGIALAGSFLHRHHNRAFFITPDGNYTYRDKRHLFRIGGEDQNCEAGTAHTIITYQGWRIALFVCYDLRFPVWCRRTPNFDYDLALFVANWPQARIDVWDTLLKARAIENQAYVCGVNRLGTDTAMIDYNGHSAVYSPRGKQLLFMDDTEINESQTTSIDLSELQTFRHKFPVWQDADPFQLL